VLEDRLAPAIVSWDGGGGDFHWENAANWSNDALPGSADNAVINTPGITVTHSSSAAVSIHSLTSLANLDWQGGSLTLTPPAPTVTSNVSGTFNNSALVEVAGGRLLLWGSGTSSGTFSVAAGAELHFSGQTTLTCVSQLTSAGTVFFDGGTNAVEGTYDVSGTGATVVQLSAVVDFSGSVLGVGRSLTVSNSTADFHGTALTVQNLALDGTLAAGDITVEALFSWENDTLTGPGTRLTIAANAEAVIGPSGVGGHRSHLHNRALDNYGTMRVVTPMTLHGGAVINNYNCFRAEASALAGSGTGEAFNNSGAFTKAVGAQLTTFSQLPFNNSGTVTVASGTLGLWSGGTSSGDFRGEAGTQLYFDGTQTFAPTVSIIADALLFGGTLNPQFESGAHFAQIAATSLRLLSPGLTISPSNDFIPHVGDNYTLINNTGTAAVDGTFLDLAEGQTIPLSDGTQLRISYFGGDGNDVVLSVLPLYLSGRVFNDGNNDGLFNGSDVGLPAVTLTLFLESDLSNPVAATATDSNGFYTFGVARRLGNYRIVETQPAGYLDGKETAGSLGGVVDNTQDSNLIRNIVVGTGTPDGNGYNFAEIRPSRIQGLVWEDFNNDGEVDFGEKAIEAVAITLSGSDDRGNPVNRTVVTDAEGIYEMLNLRPGNYTITEAQPAGFVDGSDSLGTVNGVLVGSAAVSDQFSEVVLPAPDSDGANYNFGERPLAGSSVHGGQTATIGFWRNNKGQALINALPVVSNADGSVTSVANWLAATFPNLYGAGAGPNNLTGKSNAQVADFYVSLFKLGGQTKLEAQAFAVALAVYVTNQNLAGTTAVPYGFQVTTNGVGYATFNVGNNGGAFGVANNTTMTVLDILQATDAQTHNGLLYDQDDSGTISTLEQALRAMANQVYTAINEQGDI